MTRKTEWMAAILWMATVLVGSMGASSSALAPSQHSATQSQSKQTRPSEVFPAKGRLTVLAPSQVFRFGEESAIPIKLQGPAVLTLSISQLQQMRGGFGDKEASVQHRTDGTTYVNVVPLGIGKMRLFFTILFVDGGEDFAELNIEVLPPIKPPVGLDLESSVWMDLTELGRKKTLWTQARYEVNGTPVSVAVPPNAAEYKVVMPPGDPVIKFDSQTRTMEALRQGHAIIETNYGGLRRATCVTVAEAVRFNSSGCLDLALGLSGGVSQEQRPTEPSRISASFRADDRVDILPLGHTINVAEESEIALLLHGPPVAKIESYQRKCSDAGKPCSTQVGGSNQVLSLRRESDGRTSVTVLPMALGSLEFTLSVQFTDGGIAIKAIRADVVMGTRKPDSINSSCDKNRPDLRLPVRLVLHDPAHPEWADPTSDGIGYLQPSACYDKPRIYIYLPDNSVTYKLKTESPDPVISLDPSNGTATPLRPGQVLVEEKFRGLMREVCVVVAAAANYQDGDFSNCRSLRSKQTDELTTDFAWPLPPVPKVNGAGPETPAGLRYRATAMGVLARNVKDAFNADSRVEIPLEGVSLLLGVPTKLPIRLKEPALIPVNVHQDLLRFTGGHDPRFMGQKDPLHYDQLDVVQAEYSADRSPYLTVTALRPGSAKFRFVFLFADGGVATKTLEVPVVLPAQPPQLFNSTDWLAISDGSNVTTLHLFVDGGPHMRTLYPRAVFAKGESPIVLGPQDVTFAVKTAGAAPVIQLDESTGNLTALRAGHALIQTGFAGAKLDTCVVVMANATEGATSNCEEFRSSQPAATPVESSAKM